MNLELLSLNEVMDFSLEFLCLLGVVLKFIEFFTHFYHHSFERDHFKKILSMQSYHLDECVRLKRQELKILQDDTIGTNAAYEKGFIAGLSTRQKKEEKI